MSKAKKGRTKRADAAMRRKTYIEHFIRTNDHAAAAVAAGWGSGNPRHAAQHASTQLKRYPAFRAELEARQRAVASALEIGTEQILAQVAACVHSDIRKVFTSDGALKKIHEIDDFTAKAISKIKSETVWRGHGEDRQAVLVTEVQFWSKVEMVEKAMKHLGMFREDNKQKADAMAELMSYVAAHNQGLQVRDQCSPARSTLPTTPIPSGG